MTLQFRPILTEGIAQLSYVIGDSGPGIAAVVDPRPDVDVYLQAAQELGVAITHIFETHNHADFMSGARELAHRLGNRPRVCVSAARLQPRPGRGEWGGIDTPVTIDYGFNHDPVHDGDRFEFGKVLVTARHTPGHTPEHLAFELSMQEHPDDPWGVLTGDSLFVSSVGRPDLAGEDLEEELIAALYRTMFEYYMTLPDGVIIYPGHGHGSKCGPNIGDRVSTTIGYERRFNKYLADDRFDAFRDLIRESSPPEPRYYRHMKEINREGPPLLGAGPAIPPLDPETFRDAAAADNVVVVDTREILAFGGGHVPGAMNIAARPELPVWAGWMIDPETPLLLVLERDRDLERIRSLFIRSGYTRFAGYLAGGMVAWENHGLPMEALPQMTVQQLAQQRESTKMQVLDVRSGGEWSQGRIPGARHRYAPDLRDDGVDGLDRDRPLVVYCDTGFRASIAASLLQGRGFNDVQIVPGSWEAWTSAGYEIER